MQYNLSLLHLQNAPKLLQLYIAVMSNKFGDFRIYSSMSPWQQKKYHLQGKYGFYHAFFNLVEQFCNLIKKGLKYVFCKNL